MPRKSRYEIFPTLRSAIFQHFQQSPRHPAIFPASFYPQILRKTFFYTRFSEHSLLQLWRGRWYSVLMLCIYHRADLDGRCAGAILKKRFRDASFLPMDYGEEFDTGIIARGERVIMTDFSLQPYSQMVELAARSQFTWIDHHASAIAEATDLSIYHETILDESKAACVLTWAYCFPDEPLPEAVRLLGLYDIWDHRDPRVLPFQYGVRALHTGDIESQDWGCLWQAEDAFIAQTIRAGACILDYEEKEHAYYCREHCFDTKLGAYRALAINRGAANSALFQARWDPDQYDIMIAFAYKKRFWSVTLYTTHETIHLGEIAKAYGGGGHRKAAGFECRHLPFSLPDS